MLVNVKVTGGLNPFNVGVIHTCGMALPYSPSVGFLSMEPLPHPALVCFGGQASGIPLFCADTAS